MTKDQMRSIEEALDLALEALENFKNPEIDAHESFEQCEAAITAIKQSRSAPVRGYDWMWCEAPIKTMWGHEMVVSYLAIDKDNTVSVYCERDQTTKVEAMFFTPLATQQDIQRLTALVRAQQITIDKLEAAQPAPVQSAERGEPVATKLETQQFNCFHVSAEDFQRLKALPVGAKLYTTPPAAQRQWVGLTDEEILAIVYDTKVARAIEAKLKEKNT